MEENPDSHTKEKILALLSKNPGLYISKIAEMLEMTLPTVKQHVLLMQQEKALTVVNQDGYERYYVKKQKSGIKEKRVSGIRGRIVDLITQNPGLHMSKIAELTAMRTSHVEYHLNYLEKKNILIAVKEGEYYKRYYLASSGMSEQEKKMIALLRQEFPLRIVAFLLRCPCAKYNEIQEHLGSPPRCFPII